MVAVTAVPVKLAAITPAVPVYVFAADRLAFGINVNCPEFVEYPKKPVIADPENLDILYFDVLNETYGVAAGDGNYGNFRLGTFEVYDGPLSDGQILDNYNNSVLLWTCQT